MLNVFIPLVSQALREPREAANTVVSMGIPRDALWPGFALMVVPSTLISYAGGGPQTVAGEQLMGPILFTIASGLGGAVSVFLVWRIGAALGGRGEFEEALLLTIFLQSILLAGQVIEFAVFVVSPPLAALFSFALLILTFWINLNFIAALHGFPSLWKSLGVLVLASLGVGLVLVILLSIAGVQMSPPGAV